MLALRPPHNAPHPPPYGMAAGGSGGGGGGDGGGGESKRSSGGEAADHRAAKSATGAAAKPTSRPPLFPLRPPSRPTSQSPLSSLGLQGLLRSGLWGARGGGGGDGAGGSNTQSPGESDQEEEEEGRGMVGEGGGEEEEEDDLEESNALEPTPEDEGDTGLGGYAEGDVANEVLREEEELLEEAEAAALGEVFGLEEWEDGYEGEYDDGGVDGVMEAGGVGGEEGGETKEERSAPRVTFGQGH